MCHLVCVPVSPHPGFLIVFPGSSYALVSKSPKFRTPGSEVQELSQDINKTGVAQQLLYMRALHQPAGSPVRL